MRFASALLVALVMGGGAHAQTAGGMAWGFRSGDDGVVLAWEKPDTDQQIAGFSCNSATRRLNVFFNAEPGNTPNGVALPVTWSSEAGRVQLSMTGKRDEEMGLFVMQSQTSMTADLARVMSGQTLTIQMQNKQTTIPLAGSAAGVAALVRQCGAR